MRELNREADRTKLSRKRFAEAVKVNNRAGLGTNLVFYAAILPFCVSLEPGAPLNARSMAVSTLLFTQLNTINHTWVNLQGFPFRTFSRITETHAAHHVDMNQGNYATLTTLYDRLFGTDETPVSRPAS
jgi:sterol desaturase/sphingolipid hydroxylase (fatty acid hydroxylase superfamily)